MIFIVKGSLDKKPRSFEQIYKLWKQNKESFFVKDIAVRQLSPVTRVGENISINDRQVIKDVKKLVGRWSDFVLDIKKNGIREPIIVVDVNKDAAVRTKILNKKHHKIVAEHDALVRATLKLNKKNKNMNYKFLILDGRRRATAAMNLGWKTVPAIKLEFATYKIYKMGGR